MPSTARSHFDQDIARVGSMLAEADLVPPARAGTADDIRRSAVALSVGALDAYLCDAYIDCLTGHLQAYRKGHCAKLPNDYHRELLPAGPLLAQHYKQRSNWALRMAARARMERENVLQVSRVKELFNPALPTGHKLWGDIIDRYTALERRRLTKHRATDIATLAQPQRQKARQEASAALVARIGKIVQRRHDIVHNVDRPRTALQGLTAGQAKSSVRDVTDFITILDSHLDSHRVW